MSLNIFFFPGHEAEFELELCKERRENVQFISKTTFVSFRNNQKKKRLTNTNLDY